MKFRSTYGSSIKTYHPNYFSLRKQETDTHYLKQEQILDIVFYDTHYLKQEQILDIVFYVLYIRFSN